MKRSLFTLSLVVFLTGIGRADDRVIDTMDELRLTAPKEKGRAALVEGQSGKAVRLEFDEGSRGTFVTSRVRGTADWDKAAGFSFLVKGDGTESFGGLQFIYDDDFAVRYDFLFPIHGSDWTRVEVAWRDLLPVLPGSKAKLLDPAGDNRPSKLSALWFGKWWYWRDYPAHSFAIDDLRLEPVIQRDDADHRPTGAPLSRVLEKLRAGRPITIVTMGDSLTDFRHWANREVAWPNLLRDQLREKFKSEVMIVNPAIGGTQLSQNLVLLPRWLATTPAPDLVTVCFGANDWDAGMRGDAFRAAYRDAVDRIRRATGGRADVLILTTVPGVERWETMAELAAACRAAAEDRHAGLADTEKAFLEAGGNDKERLFVRDKVHLSPAGHKLVAGTVLQAIESGR